MGATREDAGAAVYFHWKTISVAAGMTLWNFYFPLFEKAVGNYAPERNPVEYLWGHWKQHELPNLCPKDLWQLSEGPAHAATPSPTTATGPRLLEAVFACL